MKKLICSALFLLGLTVSAQEYRHIGDFETPDSFKQIWQTKRGVWAASVHKATQSEFNVRQGKFSLKLECIELLCMIHRVNRLFSIFVFIYLFIIANCIQMMSSFV